MWTANNIIGLLCLVAAAIVPWLVTDADAGRGMGSALTVLGGMLVGWSPPAPGLRVPDDKSRGMARLDLVAVIMASAAVVAVFAMLLVGGCASTVHAERSVDLDVRRGPPCTITVRADGEIVSTTTGPQKCGVVVAP